MYRLTIFESEHDGVQFLPVGISQRSHFPAEDVGHREAETSLKHPSDDGFSLASLVDSSQPAAEGLIVHSGWDTVNHGQHPACDLEADIKIGKRHPIDAFWVFLIAGTRVESQHFSQRSQFFIGKALAKGFWYYHFQFLPLRVIHETTSSLRVAIGIGDIRLDIVDRGSVHQVCSLYIDKWAEFLVFYNLVDAYTRESETIGTERRAGGKYAHPPVAA